MSKNNYKTAIKSIIVMFLGEEGLKVMRGDNGVCQQTVQGSTIAEEAVDQLQASEKLIAG